MSHVVHVMRSVESSESTQGRHQNYAQETGEGFLEELEKGSGESKG